jgi:hypothetical protein
MELRRQVRSQMEFGNEEGGGEQRRSIDPCRNAETIATHVGDINHAVAQPHLLS